MKYNQEQARHEILLMIIDLKKKGELCQAMKEVIHDLWHTPNTEYIFELHDLLKDVTETNKAA